VRRGPDRFHTELDWLDSWHSFSFGPHYDPRNTGHGLLVVSNDDVVRAGTGFGTHPHRDMEIVTWVLRGELEHRDSTGTVGIVYPGLAQRMSAGSGVTHSEMNASATADVHLVQMWVLPDTTGIAPSYEQRDVSAALDDGGLVVVASGRPEDDAIRLHQRDAVLHAGRLAAGETAALPDAPHVHVYVAVGTGVLDEAGVDAAGLDEAGATSLATGDAVRLTDAGERALTAGDDGAEVLVWATA